MADDLKTKLRTKFDKLTPEDFASVAGDKDGLTKKVAEKYGISEDEAKKQQPSLTPIDRPLLKSFQSTIKEKQWKRYVKNSSS
ncbi:hypothetical protein H2200_001650 [Cladophialophora chaetospira]|uniref:Uncharacterized protein n=1 Tax=Cladophialophora chaetospira TaxID=386627 RepID=A0AA38XM37_9EURO|nr:hypothetical protein H2200_001650 [Cladophialophora chaetospira]